MSITKARELFEKPGCGITIGVVLAAVMTASMVAQCPPGGANSAVPTDSTPVAVKVGETAITVGTLNQAYQKALEAFGANVRQQVPPEQFEGIRALQQMNVMRQQAIALVNGAVFTELARKRGIKLTDEQITASLTKTIQTQVDQMRQQMIQQGMIKPTATQAEFEAKFRELSGGRDLTAEVSRAQSEMAKQLGTTEGRITLTGEAAREAWLEAERAATTVTDATVDQIFKVARLKAILFRSPGGRDRKAEAEKVLADIRAGKIKFEDAMERFSDQPPAKQGEKKSDRIDVLAMQFLMEDEKYGSVKDLKPGEISNVIDGVEGPIIYKMVEVQDQRPADFATRREEFRNNHKMYVANIKWAELLRESVKTLPQWESPGWKSLYTIGMALENPEVPKEFPAMVQEAMSALGDPNGGTAASVAAFFGQRRQWGRMSPQEKEQGRAAYLDAFTAVLKNFDAPELRLELVDLLEAAKNPQAGAMLALAAQLNNTYAATGTDVDGRIGRKVTELQATKLISADEVKQIAEARKRWAESKKSFETAAKEAADLRAEQARLAEAAAKRAQEEAKKVQAQGPTAPAPAAPGAMPGSATSPTTPTTPVPGTR